MRITKPYGKGMDVEKSGKLKSNTMDMRKKILNHLGINFLNKEKKMTYL